MVSVHVCVSAAGAPGPKLTWREKEALKKAAMVKEMTTGVAAPAPAVKFTAKVESDSEFPTLGSAPAAKAPVKAAGVWGSVAKVRVCVLPPPWCVCNCDLCVTSLSLPRDPPCLCSSLPCVLCCR